MSLLQIVAMLASPFALVFVVRVLGGVYGWDADANRAGEGDQS